MSTPSKNLSFEMTKAPWLCLAAILTSVLIVRIVTLYFSAIDLFFDEAQYWSWSETLDFGYFSKPPILAWSIRTSTELCGLSEFCIRLPSPIMHTIAAIFIFLSAKAIYDTRTALAAAAVYATLPGISYSSGLISTDVPLLLFWTVALFALIKLLEEKNWQWAIALGAALGLGLMAKYAMAYFILCTAIYCLVDRQSRWLLTSPKALGIIIIAALLISPNIYWNIANGFVTFSHTAANAKWEGSLLHPNKALEFFGAQFGVFGPILFGALLVIIWRFFKKGLNEKDKLLLAFSLPIIAIITIQALISRAHANWAATAYPAATILVTATMLRDNRLGWCRASLALHLLVIGLLSFALINAPNITLPNSAEPFKRVLGWKDLSKAVVKKAQQGDYETLVTDHRALSSEFLYYLKDAPIKIRAWRPDPVPHDHFQLTRPLKAEEAKSPLLLVTFKEPPEGVLERFNHTNYLGSHSVATGKTSKRTVHFYSLEGGFKK